VFVSYFFCPYVMDVNIKTTVTSDAEPSARREL
jgi:hypothetical protein